jgi:hypothetical protein
MRKLSTLILMFVICFSLFSQEMKLNDDVGVLLRREKSYYLNLHTNGWGVGYRVGKHLTGYLKRMYECEFVSMKHSKEYSTSNQQYGNAKSFVYGKLNYFYILRPGIGLQKVINEKPYWGGIQLRYFGYLGGSIGFLKPSYLYILPITNDEHLKTIEKYDPDKHYIENIFGRAPFYYGLDELKIHPGAYIKAGLNFEYGTNPEKLKSLELGFCLDAYPKSVPIMAFDENNNFILTLYLSIHFGKRYN